MEDSARQSPLEGSEPLRLRWGGAVRAPLGAEETVLDTAEWGLPCPLRPRPVAEKADTPLRPPLPPGTPPARSPLSLLSSTRMTSLSSGEGVWLTRLCTERRMTESASLTKMKTTEIWGSPSEGGACLHLRGRRSALGRAADAGPAAGRRGQLYILRPSEEWQRRHRRSTRDPGKDPAAAVPGPNPPSPGPRRAPPPVRWSSPAGTAPSRFLGGLGRGGRAKRSPRGQWGSLGGRAGARISPRRPAQSAQDGRQPPVPHAAGAVPEGTGCPGWWSPNVQ